MSFLPTIISLDISLYKGSHMASPNFREMGACYVLSVPKHEDELAYCCRIAAMPNIKQAKN